MPLKGQKNVLLSLVTLTFDSSERGSKHVFRVNLAQIRSAIPGIFHTLTKTQTDGAKNRTFRSSLRAVKIKNDTCVRVTLKSVKKQTSLACILA